MPKLSQQTLEKRFQCPHCGITLRTRSGLSGHIQFKHPKGSSQKSKSITDAAYDIKKMEAFLRSIGKSDSEIADLTLISKDWVMTRSMMESYKDKLNNADFKTFQLISYAVIASEKRLKAWLTHKLGSTMI
jgi:hypothetical protein